MIVNFSDVLTIVNGKNQGKVENPNGKYPIYGSGGIMGYADEFICEPETVVIGRKGSINKPIYVETPFWNVDTAFGLCADKEKLLPKYLYYFCIHFDFEQLNTTVTIPSLTKANLLNVKMNLPNMEKQSEIVTQLDAISSLISLQEEQLSKLDELVKSRFIELFGDPKLNHKGWETATIADYYHVKGGKRIPKGMGYADGVTKHPYLRATDMKNGTIVDTDIHYIDDEVFSHIKRYIVAAGDIYLTNVGVNLGMAGVIPPKFDGASLTENAVKLVPYRDGIDGKFLSYYINSPGIQEYIDERKMTVGVPKLAIFRIETMPLIIPPIEMQRHFVVFVEQTDKLKSEVKQSLEKLETLKKSLMQEYFG